MPNPTLLVATMRGHVPLALYLLDHGAAPDAGDAGLTPLHWATGTWEGGVSNPASITLPHRLVLRATTGPVGRTRRV